MADRDANAPNGVNPPDEVLADALDLLTRDHRLVDELFTAFEQAAPQQLDPLARRICKMLRIHTQIEEEIFYPAVRRAFADGSAIDAAEQEHAEAKRSIMRVESMTSDNAAFQQAMDELAQRVAHHVREEERDLFPRIRKSRLKLDALGLALAERRSALLETLGLHTDDVEGALHQREIQQASARQERSGRRSEQPSDT
jgi:hemerythrin superfamily protein